MALRPLKDVFKPNCKLLFQTISGAKPNAPEQIITVILRLNRTTSAIILFLGLGGLVVGFGPAESLMLANRSQGKSRVLDTCRWAWRVRAMQVQARGGHQSAANDIDRRGATGLSPRSARERILFLSVLTDAHRAC